VGMETIDRVSKA